MTAIQEVYTAQEAAQELGVTDAYIRQLCIASRENKGPAIGRKHGRSWLLTVHDVDKIRSSPSFRNK